MTYVIRPDSPEAMGPRYRERAIVPARTALLSVDMQNADCAAKVRHRPLEPTPKNDGYRYFYDRLEKLVIPNQRRLQAATRKMGIENIYIVIESLTRDGRDRGIDHKASQMHYPRGSWEAAVIDEVAPEEDDIIIRKTASGPFGTTNLDYLLRNMGFDQIIVFGVLSDQCVENTVRVGGDLGYLVTLVTDCCATYSQERQDFSERAIKGYCRQRTTDQLIAELADVAKSGPGSLTAA
ncbi:isochorismatase [Hypericibacter terrae]|uniref:Isochorismatase n=1 Tax=Hypericibacter terrae TaxID=2602015 RepID=A0A5J6MGK2_9PROT|nr:isochorismatase family cysteine hydrolase [Hypericibacter terrae]QEX16602.1 isochorismatase [Hypericibacter terrae]